MRWTQTCHSERHLRSRETDLINYYSSELYVPLLVTVCVRVDSSVSRLDLQWSRSQRSSACSPIVAIVSAIVPSFDIVISISGKNCHSIVKTVPRPTRLTWIASITQQILVIIKMPNQKTSIP
jgi:hypothetical protein